MAISRIKLIRVTNWGRLVPLYTVLSVTSLVCPENSSYSISFSDHRNIVICGVYIVAAIMCLIGLVSIFQRNCYNIPFLMAILKYKCIF